jgi:cyclophilin family peptidyl-prolyl cis-trans isomerase
VPESKRGKRRRGSHQRSGGQPASTSPKPVGPSNVNSSIPGVPWLVGGAVVVIVLVVGLILLQPFTGGGAGADASASPGAPASPGASTAAGSSVAAGSCPTSQPPALPAGETRTVTLDTAKGAMVLTIEADLSPIAAGNFVALASCGFYDGTPFHRTPTLDDGTPFVIQGGDPTGTGTGGPGYTITDETVTTPYKRGTVAMARSLAPNSVGSQFFIVLDDKDGDILGRTNTYQIIGNVTSGMETADAIFAASGGVELPADPVTITTATVTNP